MPFINQQQSERMLKWINEHPQEYSEYQKKMQKLTNQLFSNEIPPWKFTEELNKLWSEEKKKASDI